MSPMRATAVLAAAALLSGCAGLRTAVMAPIAVPAAVGVWTVMAFCPTNEARGLGQGTSVAAPPPPPVKPAVTADRAPLPARQVATPCPRTHQRPGHGGRPSIS